MEQKIRKWGSISILSTIGGTLVGAVIIWLFGQAVNIQPMADAIDRLTVVTEKANKINTQEHKIIVDKLYQHDSRLGIAEIKLERVIFDCKNNGYEIKECNEETQDDKR